MGTGRGRWNRRCRPQRRRGRRIRIRRPNHLSRSCVHKTMTLPNGEKGRERGSERERGGGASQAVDKSGSQRRHAASGEPQSIRRGSGMNLGGHGVLEAEMGR